MRQVKCYECGRSYDYDQDGFCPRCGAFNQPPRSVRVDADGTVIRVDGLNEENHAESFAHRELHAETRERRRSGLDRGRGAAADTMAKVRTAQKRQTGKGPLAILIWVIAAIIFMNVLSSIFLLFS